MNFKIWMKAIRFPFFTATIIPIVLGSLIAWYDTGNFIWMRFVLSMFGAVLIHTGTNLANDFFDHLEGCDEANLNPTPFSGGSRVIQDGLIEPRKIIFVSLCSFIIGANIGLYLNYLTGTNIILILGIIGVFLGFFHNFKYLPIYYGGWGELAVGIGFGPLMVLGSYYVQAKQLPLHVFLVSVPVGILIALVLFINEFPDYLADKTVGKKTLVVVLGKRNAMALYHILLVAVYLLIFTFVMFKVLPYICLIVFLTLPLAVKAFVVSMRNFDKIYELLPANASTIGLHSLVGLLLSLGFVMAKIF